MGCYKKRGSIRECSSDMQRAKLKRRSSLISGYYIDLRHMIISRIIQLWVRLTGRRVDFDRYPILAGPMGEDEEIGEEFYGRLATAEGLRVQEPAEGGLLEDFREVLDRASPFYHQLDPEIPEFYEHTSRYSLEVWSRWTPLVSWGAKLLIRLVSVEIKQLNIPLDPLETSYGMSSSIIHLVNEHEEIAYVCWLRTSLKSNNVVYAGFYSSYQLSDLPYKHVRVVFPLPNGNVTVILRAELLEDGSVRLVSNGKKFGGAGYYRLHRTAKDVVKARMIPIKEVIHVFRDPYGTMRTDHYFKWWNIPFLQLHYKIMPRELAHDEEKSVQS